MRTSYAITLCLLSSMAVALPAVAQTPVAPGGTVAADTRRLSVDDAVRQALEHNLGIKVARVSPQVQDLTLTQLRGAFAPTLTSSVAQSHTDTPASSFLSGADLKTTDSRTVASVGVRQSLKWGGASYSLGWDNSRTTTNNLFVNFSPQVNSSVSFSFVQPLLKNFRIDNVRQQLEIGQKNRDISDLDLQASIAATTRSVRNAYWDLAYAIEALKVQQQSLALARESLRNNKARVEIGTMAPIDIVEAEAEVAQRDEAVIVAEAAIERSEDTLRALIYDTRAPDFWTIRLDPTDRPPFQPMAVDVERAVKSALDQRTDLKQARKTIESSDISLRYLHNQTLPEVNAQVDYGLSGLGGTQALRGTPTGGSFLGPVIGSTVRGYGSVVGDIFTNDFPKWTVSVNVTYPLGNSQQETAVTRARLQYSQSQTQLQNQQLQVTSQVREAARALVTNQKRVSSSKASRELAERRLEAEQKKFTAGQSTSFFVFQAQRDLAVAQNNELKAVLDFNKSVVDFETVQQAPLSAGSTGVTAVAAAPTAATAGTAAASSGSGTAQRGF